MQSGRRRADGRGRAGDQADISAPYRVAFQLLRWTADHFAEIDGGQLYKTGRGITALTPRQACNLALACITAPLDEEQTAQFMEELYAAQGADSTAKQQLREHMKSLGVDWDGEV